MADDQIASRAIGERADELGGAPRPLKRWHLLVLGGTATAVAEEPLEEESERRILPRGPERPERRVREPPAGG